MLRRAARLIDAVDVTVADVANQRAVKDADTVVFVDDDEAKTERVLKVGAGHTRHEPDVLSKAKGATKDDDENAGTGGEIPNVEDNAVG